VSGICGILHFDRKLVDQSVLKRMTALLEYRGPDGQDIWVNDHVCFGHTLFRTTYESANEHQPCTLDSKVYITADARIDARDELIPLLKAKGCKVAKDAPDVELILHAYQVWGEECVTHLLGDFVFAIWDGHQEKLFCARDHFGLRVLYYAQVGNTLVFSNTLRCVQGYPDVTDKLNDQAIGDFLLFGSYTWLDKSITTFADIHKVPPAHVLTWDRKGLKIKRYWDIPLDTPLLRYRKEEDYLEHFREVLRIAVKDRIRTDRVVISMSGGLDSTSVAAMACRIAYEESHSTQITAFTAVYDRIHPDKERYYSKLVADKLGLPIHYFVCDDYQLLMPALITPEPIEIYTPECNLNQIRQAAALGRVILTGRSTDNLLTPSPVTLVSLLSEINPAWALLKYVHLWRRYGKRLPLGTGLMNKLKRKQPASVVNSSYGYPCWLNPDFEARLGLKDRWQAMWSWHPLPLHPRHPQAHESLVLPDWDSSREYLPGIDFTPAEYVDPYMDLRMVNFVLSLLPLPWCFNKYLVRQAMTGCLPDEVLMRPKTPLGALLYSLLEQPNTNWVDHWEPNTTLLFYINRQAIPLISQGACNNEESYVNIRPLLLNIWLNGQGICGGKTP
jgi:asparagine synthase (glutamine-hydrolysing)